QAEPVNYIGRQRVPERNFAKLNIIGVKDVLSRWTGIKMSEILNGLHIFCIWLSIGDRIRTVAISSYCSRHPFNHQSILPDPVLSRSLPYTCIMPEHM